jgi:drug/metabolite transporter (DMT)-like permease
MVAGFFCALGAGLMWGLVFVVPLLLPDYPGMVLSFGRYIGYGLFALMPAFFDRRRVAALTKADWIASTRLSLVGNLLYYAALASAIQLADAPLPAMMIGTLPVIIAIFANRKPHLADSVAWRRLAPPLMTIFIGLLLVNASELTHMASNRPLSSYLLGCLIGIGAVAAWTWYPIMNARYMQAHPHIASSTWATVQGLTTLPLALAGFAAYGLYNHFTNGHFAFPLGPHPGLFTGLMLAMGICASWFGTMLWNRASQRLPTTLAGQLIVFETLAALLYAFILRGSLPGLSVLAGVTLLCIGVALGVRVFRPATIPGD